MSNPSIWPINRTLSGVTTPSQSRHGSDGKEGVPHIPQNSSITGASPSDLFYVISGHSLGAVLLLCRDIHKNTRNHLTVCKWITNKSYMYIHLTVCKQMIDVTGLLLHNNSWKHFIVFKQVTDRIFVLNRNTWNHLTLCKRKDSFKNV